MKLDRGGVERIYVAKLCPRMNVEAWRPSFWAVQRLPSSRRGRPRPKGGSKPPRLCGGHKEVIFMMAEEYLRADYARPEYGAVAAQESGIGSHSVLHDAA